MGVRRNRRRSWHDRHSAAIRRRNPGLGGHRAPSRCLPLLALVDVTLQRLPDRIVLPALGLITLIDIIGIAVAPEIALRALACAGGVAAIAALGWALPRSTLGLGDVKVMILTALVTGSISVAACIATIVAGFLLAGLAAGILLATRKAERPSMIAFGPYLLAGSWLAIIFA